jgi:hypothetical protein
MGEGQHAEIGREETDGADAHGRAKVAANDVHIDFGAGEKRQQDRPEPCEIVHPGREGQIDDVAGDGADNYFEQGDRNRDPALRDGSDQGKPNPQSRRKPDIVHPKTSSAPGAAKRKHSSGHSAPPNSERRTHVRKAKFNPPGGGLRQRSHRASLTRQESSTLSAVWGDSIPERDSRYRTTRSQYAAVTRPTSRSVPRRPCR